MAALSSFLRKTPPEALRAYFDRPEIGLPTEFEWPATDTDLSGPLLGAIEKMSRVQRDRISNDAERVHALSDEPGQAAIYSVAEDAAFLDGLANPHARSLVLCCPWLLSYDGATARHAIYGGQWRRLDRCQLGRDGPFQSVISRRLPQGPERIRVRQITHDKHRTQGR